MIAQYTCSITDEKFHNQKEEMQIISYMKKDGTMQPTAALLLYMMKNALSNTRFITVLYL